MKKSVVLKEHEIEDYLEKCLDGNASDIEDSSDADDELSTFLKERSSVIIDGNDNEPVSNITVHYKHKCIHESIGYLYL